MYSLTSDYSYPVNKCRNFNSSYSKTQKMYKYGVDKLRSELDVVKILHSIRRLEILTHFVMTEQQIAICKFIKSDTLNTSTSIDINKNMSIK